MDFAEKKQQIVPPTTRMTRMEAKQAEARKAAEAAYEANKKLNEKAKEDSSSQVTSGKEIVQNNLEEPPALAAAANTEPSKQATCQSAPASLAQRPRVRRRRKQATCRSVPECVARRVARPKQVTWRSASRPKTTAIASNAIQIDDDQSDIIVIDETETEQDNNETRSSQEKSPRTPALKVSLSAY